MTQYILGFTPDTIDMYFFPGPLAFCKKAVERVNSEKNILNSSVECVEWSGFFKKKSYVCTSSDPPQ